MDHDRPRANVKRPIFLLTTLLICHCGSVACVGKFHQFQSVPAVVGHATFVAGARRSVRSQYPSVSDRGAWQGLAVMSAGRS